ncbi:hypothetical protein [Mesorhizobium sp. M0496]|uniref:hypothetical protein n=1 Tax=Mesorhizobium sp. M0496 TaxID=2956952 RepID=UPI00333890A3
MRNLLLLLFLFNAAAAWADDVVANPPDQVANPPDQQAPDKIKCAKKFTVTCVTTVKTLGWGAASHNGIDAIIKNPKSDIDSQAIKDSFKF